MATKILTQDLQNSIVPNGEELVTIGANKYYGTNASGQVGFFTLTAGVVQAVNLAAFPATGSLGTLYIAQDTNRAYRWNGTTYQLTGDDEVQVFPNFAAFPTVGSVGIEYIDLALDKTYIRDTATSTYVLQGGNNPVDANQLFALSAGATTITLSFTPVGGKNLFLFRNGVKQRLGSTNDYTISGAVITLLIPAFASDLYEVAYQY